MKMAFVRGEMRGERGISNFLIRFKIDLQLEMSV